MVPFIQLMAVILAGVAVAIADGFIKKVATTGDWGLILKDPLMIAIILLYLAQVIFFIYVFKNGWNLGIVGVLQMVFYAVTILIIGVIFFHESLTTVQLVGIALALIGVILINL